MHEEELLRYWSTRQNIRAKLIEQVTSQIEDIDPNNELDQELIIYGWAIGQGMTPADASTFANLVITEMKAIYPEKIELDTVAFVVKTIR